MQLSLIIIAGLGALLFVISLLSYAVAGFRHHFVTGLIALFPVLNIVTLPSLWDRNSGKFFLGLISLIIAVTAWVFGANTAVHNLLSNKDTNSGETVIVSASPNQSEKMEIQTLDLHGSKQKEITITEFKGSGDIQLLPTKALYRMGFDVVPVDQINTLLGRVVQITNNNNKEIEGRIIKLTTATVMLDNSTSSELPISSIKQLKLMVRKSN